MATNKDQALEKKLLSINDIDKQMEDLQNQRYELQIKQAKEKGEPLRITELTELKTKVSQDGKGNKLIEAECFSDKAVYQVFNFKTKTQTQLHGMQIDSLFGLNDETRLNFAKGNFGKSYAIGNYRFTFEYLEREV